MNPLHKEIVPVTTWQKVTFWFFVNLFPRNIAMMKENFFQNVTTMRRKRKSR
jgi:hypothetical protein